MNKVFANFENAVFLRTINLKAEELCIQNLVKCIARASEGKDRKQEKCKREFGAETFQRICASACARHAVRYSLQSR